MRYLIGSVLYILSGTIFFRSVGGNRILFSIAGLVAIYSALSSLFDLIKYVYVSLDGISFGLLAFLLAIAMALVLLLEFIRSHQFVGMPPDFVMMFCMSASVTFLYYVSPDEGAVSIFKSSILYWGLFNTTAIFATGMRRSFQQL